MAANELVPRKPSLPAAAKKEVFVDWYAGREEVNFDIYAGDPRNYTPAALESIEHMKGLENVVSNSGTRSGELIIVGCFTAAYQNKPAKIKQVMLAIQNLLDIKLRYVAYAPGDGMKEFTLEEWAKRKART